MPLFHQTIHNLKIPRMFFEKMKPIRMKFPGGTLQEKQADAVMLSKVIQDFLDIPLGLKISVSVLNLNDQTGIHGGITGTLDFSQMPGNFNFHGRGAEFRRTFRNPQNGSRVRNGLKEKRNNRQAGNDPFECSKKLRLRINRFGIHFWVDHPKR